MNSLMPLGAKNVSGSMKSFGSTLGNSMNTMGSSVAKTVNRTSVPYAPATGLYISLSIFFFLLIGFIVLFSFFSKEISYGFNNFMSSLRSALGTPTPAPPPPVETPVTEDDTPVVPSTNTNDLIDKILPGSKEVFNVSNNRYTYYDAEPLCKALGAELATYDQIKEAWSKGADWCNYGWVKGQQALYPTQNDTWEKLQQGPEDDRLKCGQPGVNGGYFDNPEQRFGVNCYGAKPSQSAHDASVLEQGAPMSPSVIEYDKKVAKFRSESDTLGIMPYNSGKWSDS